MKIPVQNLYFLLVYAWDVLNEARLAEKGATSLTVPADLFAQLLRNGIDHVLKRGLDRAYATYTDAIPGIRGRVELNASIKSMSFIRGRVVCSFDELSHDVIHNQILKATLHRLIKVTELNHDLRHDLCDLMPRFYAVSDIRPSGEAFRKVQLHSNNKFYRILIDVCRILHYQLLPEQVGEGYRFKEFSEEQLGSVFESFIRNFYKREQTQYEVKRDWFRWQDTTGSEKDIAYLPKMETDASLNSVGRKIVIETKFYKSALAKREDFNSESVRSGHLYQVFAYLQHLQIKERKAIDGVLLYPRNGEDFTMDYIMFGHKLRVATIDLDASPEQIRIRLLSLIDLHGDTQS